MALTTCPECGKEMSTEAEFCPNCGYQQRETGRKTTRQESEGDVTSPQSNRSIFLPGCLAISVGVGCGAPLLFVLGWTLFWGIIVSPGIEELLNDGDVGAGTAEKSFDGVPWHRRGDTTLGGKGDAVTDRLWLRKSRWEIRAEYYGGQAFSVDLCYPEGEFRKRLVSSASGPVNKENIESIEEDHSFVFDVKCGDTQNSWRIIVTEVKP